jgi:hypothetical protein
MALTQEQVDWWFSQNPDATADEVAEAVKSVGGLEGNAGLADMIANRYDIGTNQVTDYYNTYTAPTTGATIGDTTGTTTLSANPTAAELTALYANSGATTPTTTTTEQGDQTTYNPIVYNNNGTDFSLWTIPGAVTYDSSSGMDATPVSGPTTLGGYSKQDGDFTNYYDLNNKLVHREKWNISDFERIWNDLGPIITAVGTGYLGTIPLGTTGLTAGNALNAVRAIDSGNWMGALSNTIGALPGGTFNVAGYTPQDALNVAKFVTAATNNDAAGLLTSVGNLTGSSDVKLAGAAATVLSAANSGNDKTLFDAVTGLSRVLNSGSTTGTTTADAGADVTLPGGVQLASAGDGVFRTDVGGVPTYAESSNASTVKAPLGYTLLSMSESDEKPAGSYYDITANAWFKPDAAITDLTGSSNILSDIDLFTSSQGDLDQIAATTESTSDDALAAYLASIGITNTTQLEGQDLSTLLDLNTATGTSTVTGGTGNDVVTGGNITDTTGLDTGEVIPTDGTSTVTGGTGNDVEELVVTAPRECDAGFHDDGTGFCIPDDDKIVTDEGEIVVTDKKEVCLPGTRLNPETGECDPYWDEGEGDVCDVGEHLDPATGMCVPDVETTIKCDDGFHLGPDGKTCVADEKDDRPCDAGFHKNDTGLCVPDDDEECEDGYEKVNGACVPVCKEGYIRNLETGTCEKVEDKPCPVGQVRNADGKCVPIKKTEECKPGYERANGVCVPICQPGYQRVNGVCKKITKDAVIPTPTTSGLSAQGERTDPIYAGAMDDFNLFATLEELLSENSDKKDTKKDNKKSKDKTKMATGGHLDDLLAEQMTVDDLLKLLR